MSGFVQWMTTAHLMDALTYLQRGDDAQPHLVTDVVVLPITDSRIDAVDLAQLRNGDGVEEEGAHWNPTDLSFSC